jgi:hypothetical protein
MGAETAECCGDEQGGRRYIRDRRHAASARNPTSRGRGSTLSLKEIGNPLLIGREISLVAALPHNKRMTNRDEIIGFQSDFIRPSQRLDRVGAVKVASELHSGCVVNDAVANFLAIREQGLRFVWRYHRGNP